AAGRNLLVDVRAHAHRAGHAQAILVTDFRRDPEHFGIVGIGHDLHDALMVAQVDEHHAAMVTACIGPAAQGGPLPDVVFPDQTAIVATHRPLPVAPTFGRANRKC